MSEQIILNEVIKELRKATSNYGRFLSPHEGYSIILEELEELWIEIKKEAEEEE